MQNKVSFMKSDDVIVRFFTAVKYTVTILKKNYCEI